MEKWKIRKQCGERTIRVKNWYMLVSSGKKQAAGGGGWTVFIFSVKAILREDVKMVACTKSIDYQLEWPVSNLNVENGNNYET